ncbi:MAG: MFS transporter, partial [Actinomycetota bacterium]
MNRALKTMFRSLRVRNYRIYFFAQIISMIGTWAQITAQMWLVLQLTGSGVALGVVSALQFLPVLIGGAWGGVIADRFDKRRLLMATQGAGGLIAIALGTLTVAGVVELWMVYALAVLMGCVLVVDVPTRQSFLTEMVGKTELANAVGLNSTVFTTARIVGPAVSAALISTVGIGWAFMLNGFSYVAVISGLRAMDPSALMRSEPVTRTKGQLLDGLRYVWAKPVLRSSLLLMAVVGTLAFNFRIFLPLMAESVFDGDAGTYGILSSVMGAGTLVGALIAT